MGLRDFFKIDNRPPGTDRRAAAKAKREAEQKAAAAKKVKMAEQIKARNAKEKARQGKAMAKTAVSRPTPKRPSAISLKNAAEQKAKRPMKPEVPPTNRVKPPMDEVTGKGGRNVGTGKDKKANVTKEQLDASGMSLRNYLNFMDKNGKRPPKAGKMMGGKKSKYNPKKMMGGGMAMKSKGYSKGGAMKTKGYSAGGKLPMVEKDGKMIPAYAADGKGKMMAGGPVKKMKTKGYSKGGAMKTKGYSKGGVLGGKKNKVRGAGIARKGVRPAKML